MKHWYAQADKPMRRAIQLVEDGILSIDEDGQIWRHKIISHGSLITIAARRAENVGGKGYLRVSMSDGVGGLDVVMAHRLVWAISNKQVPADGLQINHKDLNKQNNATSNLELVTQSENMRHSYTNGRKRPWSTASNWRGKPIISKDSIQKMIALRSSGATITEISERFNISKSHAHRLIR